MRHLRELPKIPPLQCEHIDCGWCKTNKKWCHLMENCVVKVGEPVEKPLTPKEINTISERHNALIRNVVLSHPRGKVTTATTNEIANKLGLTYQGVLHRVIRIRKELRKDGHFRDN